MATARFLDVFEEETNKMKASAISLTITRVINTKTIILLRLRYHLLTESEVITGKSQTEAFMYWPSDSEVNTSRLKSGISL